METRELYRQKYEAQLHEWSAKIDVLKAQAEMMTVQAQLDMKPKLDVAHEKLESAKERLHDIAVAADDGWEGLKKTADHTWSDVIVAVEGALDLVKTHPAN